MLKRASRFPPLRKLLSISPLLSALLYAGPALAYRTAVVTADSMSIRGTADPSSPVIGSLPKGTRVNTSDKSVKGYIRLRAKAVTGWARVSDMKFGPIVSNRDSLPLPDGRDSKPRAAEAPPSHDKSFNIRINPLGLLVGGLSVNGDVVLGEHVSLGPDFSYLKTTGTVTGNSYAVTATTVGLHLTFYLSNTALRDSWYVSPMIGYGPYKFDETIGGVDFNSSINVLSAGLMGGYQWVWDGGFNITLGGGAVYYSTASTIVIANASGTTVSAPLSSVSGIVPALDFSLGYAF